MTRSPRPVHSPACRRRATIRGLLVLLAAVVIVAFAPSAHAQADSLASVQYELYPYAKRVGVANEQLGVSIFRAAAGFPLFLSKKTLLIPTLGYERFEASIRGPEGHSSLLLQAPSLTMMLMTPISERISLLGSVGVGLASDFSGPLSEQDLLLSGLLVGIYKFSDAFSFGTGVSYDRRSGSLLPVPLAIMRWQMSSDARVIGALPANLSFEYRVTPWLSSGFRAAFNGNRYHFGAEQYGRESLQLAYSNVVLGPKLVFSAGEWIHLEAYAAVTAYRRYDVYFEGNSIAEVNLAPTMGYGVRLWIGPSFWKKPEVAPTPTSTSGP